MTMNEINPRAGSENSREPTDTTGADAGVKPTRSWDRKRLVSWASFFVFALAIIVAFRTILVAPLGLSAPGEFEYWFFIPNRDSGALSIFVSIWLFWNRRNALMCSTANSVAWPLWLGAAFLFPMFSWAIWMSAQALLIPILCLTLMLLGFAWGGRSAVALMMMPCAALMLAFPPPAPLQTEIIWRLQNWTAGGANLVLSMAGLAPQLEGTELRLGSHVFVIIEACSGWRGIQVLSLVGLAAAELRELSFRRTLWVVLAAIPLGLGLNVLRACLVMLTQEELKAEFFESHTPQGIAVLVIGGVVLYAIAMRLQDERSPIESISRVEDSTADDAETKTPSGWLAIGCVVSFGLVAISVGTPMLREPLSRPTEQQVRFPLALYGWSGEKLRLDYFFPYSTPANPQFHAEYRRSNSLGGEKLVDLFIAWETPRPAGLDRMPDSKLLLPTNDWTIDSHQRSKVWQLGFEAEQAIVVRGDRSKISYVIAWRIRDRGLLHEAFLSLLGLPGCGDSPNGCPRVVVRLAVPIFRDDEDGRNLARETANEFIAAFIFPLRMLALR